MAVPYEQMMSNTVLTVTIRDDEGSCSHVQKETDEKENCFNICPICFELSDSQVVLPCRHSFHLSCYNSYLLKSITDSKTELKCPYCSEQILQVVVERQPRNFPTFVIVGDTNANDSANNHNHNGEDEDEEELEAPTRCVNSVCLRKTFSGIVHMAFVALIVYVGIQFTTMIPNNP